MLAIDLGGAANLEIGRLCAVCLNMAYAGPDQPLPTILSDCGAFANSCASFTQLISGAWSCKPPAGVPYCIVLFVFLPVAPGIKRVTRARSVCGCYCQKKPPYHHEEAVFRASGFTGWHLTLDALLPIYPDKTSMKTLDASLINRKSC